MPYTKGAYVRFRVHPRSDWEIGTYFGQQRFSYKVIDFSIPRKSRSDQPLD